MNAKQTNVVLKGEGVGECNIELSHAEYLLNWNGSGWTLADDAYVFTDGKLVRKVKEEAKAAKTDKKK